MNAAFKGFSMSLEIYWDFPGSLVVKTMLPQQRAIPGQGPKISHTMWHGQKVEKKSKKKTKQKPTKINWTRKMKLKQQ